MSIAGTRTKNNRTRLCIDETFDTAFSSSAESQLSILTNVFLQERNGHATDGYQQFEQ
jgi:hypothetical protein